MRRLLSGLIAAGVALALSACQSKEPTNPAGELPDVPSGTTNLAGAADPKLAGEPVDPRLVAGNTRFALNLFGRLARAEPANNVFISPASVSIALAMTYNGADGTTKDSMASVLGLDGMSLDEVNRANLVLLSNLAYADPKVRLAIANSLWAKQGMPFYDDFLARNRESFGAEVRNLDFGDPNSVKVINDWVSNNTNDRIKNILDMIPDGAILYLVNAIWFKGTWTEEFDKADTRDRPFTLASGAQKSVPMMSQDRRFAYHEEPGFQAVSLPYGSRRFSMYVFLPAGNSSLGSFVSTLTPENWNRWMAAFDSSKGTVALPRFKIEYKTLLNDPLVALGMGVAFSMYQADFRKMLPVSPEANAYISRVIHQSFVEVNEEGTEAAAATVVEIGVTSAPPQGFTMVVDRPFFVAIRDNVSGTILFMGTINDPQP